MPITLHITKEKRVRYLLPFTDSELARLLGHMAQRVGLEDVAIELSILDDKTMADLNNETMGTRGPTNILSFPLVYDTFAPYIMKSDAQADGQTDVRNGARNGTTQSRNFPTDNVPSKNAVFGAPFEKSCPQRYVPDTELGVNSSSEYHTPGGAPETTCFFGPVLLGLLAISPETVQREARLYGQHLETYSIFLLAHGFAHLLGYDHGAEMDALTEFMQSGALGL